MSNNKQVKLPKNKILLLLVAILAVAVALLAACIVLQTRGTEPDEPAAAQPQGGASSSEVFLTEQLPPPRTAEDYKRSPSNQILRSENGKLTITDRDQLVAEGDGANQADSRQGFQGSVPAPRVNAAAIDEVMGGGSGESSGEADDDFPYEEEDNAPKNVNQPLFGETGGDIGRVYSAYQSSGTLVFVFDDAGHNMSQLQPFLELPFPSTIAVLPGLDYSAEAAKKARGCGKEVILHQPMQAQNLDVDPGPGAITPEMGEETLFALVRHNLASIGPVAGINNHEGSLITSDERLMGAILDLCRTEQIYFLDSRTAATSVAKPLAAQRGMKIWERAVFLDNSPKREDMAAAVRLGMELAAKNGVAIMIGHVWSQNLPEVLEELYPEMLMQSYNISTISKIQDRY